MNADVVRNALGELNRQLGRARSALSQVEAEMFDLVLTDENGTFEEPRAALGAILQESCDILIVVLEAADMPETRASLLSAWQDFKAAKGGLKHTVDYGQYENCESPALDFLQRVVKGLELSTTKGMSSEEAWTLNRLEAMLEDTAAFVHRRKVTPKDEHEVQAVMHDYLRACFPGFTPKPQINGAIKNFKPDCGISNINAAIEFKIIHTEKDVAVAFSGVTEDTAGYRGSKDWTRFYAVFYQSQPFILKSHLQHDMKRIGASTWTSIVVNGPTKSKKKRVRTKSLRVKSKAVGAGKG